MGAEEGRKGRERRRGAAKKALIRRYPNPETDSDENRSALIAQAIWGGYPGN